MKRTWAFVIACVFALGVSADAEAGRGGGGGRSSSHRSSRPATGTGASSHSHTVKGYTTKRGTTVAPHKRTDPDRTQRNNYSTKGNTNPWNGKRGTKTATH
ncbi:MAG: hypothetical protein KIT31_23380 [Deltaproteobacteria bacterium]|nr:hypothetical protein [Deltaproteobacteria bacterium]